MVTTTTLNFTAAATSKSYAYQIASIVSTNWPKYTHYYFEKKSIDSFSSSSYIIFLNNSYEEERKKYINPCALLSLFFSVSLYRLHIFLLRFISVLTCFFFLLYCDRIRGFSQTRKRQKHTLAPCAIFQICVENRVFIRVYSCTDLYFGF